MIFYLIKNTRYKYVLTIILSLVVFLILIKLEGMQGMDALRAMYGGVPLYRPIVFLSFVMCMSMIQYLHVDSIILLMKRDMYLIVRYSKSKKLLAQLLVSMVITNTIAVMLELLVFYGVMLMTHVNIADLCFGTIVEIGVRGWLSCILFSFLQVLCMILFDEKNSFFLMLGLAIVLGISSNLNLGVYSLLPIKLTGIMLFENIVICIIYIVVITCALNLLYQKKEWNGYGN